MNYNKVPYILYKEYIGNCTCTECTMHIAKFHEYETWLAIEYQCYMFYLIYSVGTINII